MKTGKIKKKNDDGMSGILTDDGTRKDLVWIDQDAPNKGIGATGSNQPVNYYPIEAMSQVVIGTDLSVI